MPYPDPQLQATSKRFCDGRRFVAYFDLGNVMYLHDGEVVCAPMNADGTPCSPGESHPFSMSEFETPADEINAQAARDLLLGALHTTRAGIVFAALRDRLKTIGRRHVLAEASFGEAWRDVVLGDGVVHGVAMVYLRPSHDVETAAGMPLKKTVLLGSLLTDTPVVSTDTRDELWECDVFLVPRRKGRGTEGTVRHGFTHDRLMTSGFVIDEMAEPDYDIPLTTT